MTVPSRPHRPRMRSRGSQFTWQNSDWFGSVKATTVKETPTTLSSYTANITPQNEESSEFTVTVKKDTMSKQGDKKGRTWLKDKGGGRMNLNREYPTIDRAQHAADVIVRSEENKWNRPRVRHARPDAG